MAQRFNPKTEYGFLTPVSVAYRRGFHVIWTCRCRCGNTKEVYQSNLVSGHTKSCGCDNRKKSRERRLTHGQSRTRLYEVWKAMIRRCENKNAKQYEDYGGRGIQVCRRWRESYEAFIEDMGMPPTPEHSIERRDNDKGYSPENCFWGTRKEQARNKRNNRLLTHDGRTQCTAAWSEETGLSVYTIYARLKLGWTVDEALTAPLYQRRRRT